MNRKMMLFALIASVSLLFACSPSKAPKKGKSTVSVKGKSPKTSKFFKIAKALVKEKGDMNQGYDARNKKKKNGIPILVWAVGFSDVNAVKLLLKNGANPNVKVKPNAQNQVLSEGITGIDLETSVADFKKRSRKTLYICKLLIQAGANVNYKTNFGQTALHKAAQCGRGDICDLLIKNKAKVNVTDKLGTTPLHKAARDGHWKAVKVLLKNKAVVNKKNRLKKTALGLANKRSDEDLYKKVRRELPLGFPNSDYDKTIKILKSAGGKSK